MWNLAREREMAIWFQVAVRLKENVRRSRWRIIARKLNRFVRNAAETKSRHSSTFVDMREVCVNPTAFTMTMILI